MNELDPDIWGTTLENEDRAQARSALDELTEALVDLPIAPSTPSDLGRGLAGRALALMYLSQVPRYRHARSRALDCLDAAIEGLARDLQVPSLFSGIAGITWTAHHLQKHFPDHVGQGGGEEVIDAYLLEHLERGPWRGDYDLISGLVGIGLYACESLPRRSASRLLTRVIEHLEDLACPMAQGLSWHTPPTHLPEWQRQLDPKGYFNLGVAHGVPAVINLLARAHASGIRAQSTRRLAVQGYRWLASVRFPLRAECCFGTIVGFDGSPDAARASRIAWCYGDLGLSVSLLGAARNLRDLDMEASILEVARSAAQRSLQQCRSNDAGFCHGAAGNGHLFNRLFQATGDRLFLNAARAWMRSALDLRVPGQGIGGYRAWLRPDHAQDAWLDESGLLEGSAGIALALLSACEPIAPDWDAVMMADIPEWP
jgi:lantibiotic modifying enzyme